MADTTVLQGAIEHWKAFDWSATLTTIDTTLQQSKEAREQAVTARKQLSEVTKQLKRSVKSLEQSSTALNASATSENVQSAVKAVESVNKECRTTVKAYQEEVDNITRRCKSAESGFQGLAQALTPCSDPAALLQSAVQQIQAQQAQMTQLLSTVDQVNQELQSQELVNANYKKEIATLKANSSSNTGMSKEEREELVQLRREVAEYEVEFRSLKNQDITIRKLEAKIAELQTNSEEQLKDQLEKQKEELAETEGRRAAEALEREAAMERKAHSLELQLKAERAGREATQAHLLEADEGVSQREAAWEAQRQILVDDAERVRESLQAATRERDELRLRVAARENADNLPTPPPSTGVSMADLMLERKAYEAEVAELSETATLLREELRMKEDKLVSEKRSYETKVDNLEREKNSLNTTVASLEAQLASAPNPALVESMKRELRILKQLEYNADDVDHERDPEIAGGSPDDDKDLESVLVGKLRRAESELVTERTSKSDLMREIDSLKEALADAEKAKDEADKLVASLEKDLERAISTPSPPPVRKKKEPALAEENPATLQTILDPNAPTPPAPPPASPAVTAAATEKAEDDHSVATIVMAQRDRLRARCEALEAERDSFKRELQVQVQASESLKADNTKLYEKVRYLQSYNQAPRSGVYNRSSSGVDRDLDLEALEQRYEASVDPFKQFSKAERQRKLNEMSPMERTVFIVAKTVLATKEMRTGLFCYVVALHLLVFVTTYHWSHAGTCHVDNEALAHLPPALPAHIQEQMAAKAAETVANPGN